MLRKTALCTILVGFSLLAAGSASASPIASSDPLTVTLSKEATCVIPDGEYAQTVLLTPDANLWKYNEAITANTPYNHTLTIQPNISDIPDSCNDVAVVVSVSDSGATASENVTFGAVTMTNTGNMTLGDLKTIDFTITLPVNVGNVTDVASQVSYQYPITVSIKPVN